MLQSGLYLVVPLLLTVIAGNADGQHAEQNWREIVQNAHDASEKMHLLFGGSAMLPMLQSSAKSYLDEFKTQAVNYNVSELCMNRTLTYLDDLLSGQAYALRMLDATAKPGAGILDLNTRWMGSYEECLSVKSANKTDGLDFGADYCMVSGPQMTVPGSVPFPVGLRVALCVPDTCTRDDVIALSNAALSVISPTTQGVKSAECASDSLPWRVGDAVAIFFCIIFLFLATLGTLYDVYERHRQTAPVFMVNHASDDVTTDADVKEHSSIEVPDNEPLVSFRNKNAESLEQKKGPKALLAFSVLKNCDRLFDVSGTQKDIQVIHGIRALSMWWVILGHTHAFYAIGFVDNIAQGLPIIQRWTFQAVGNATFSVDSFFFLSGLLVAYLTLKYLRANDGKMQWLMFYVHRYLRLTPVFAFFMLCFATLYTHLPRTPQGDHSAGILAASSCTKYWWTNLLYINNFYPLAFGDECMGWVWYLANDMQFYVISPLFIIALYRRPKLGVILTGVAILLSMGITGFISTYFQSYGTAGPAIGLILPQGQHLYPNTPGFDYVYTKPYCRISVYLVGILTGYVLYLTNCKPEALRLKTPLVVVCWLAAWATALAVIYGFAYDIAHSVVLDPHLLSFYTTVSRFAWSISLAWLVIACVHGYGSYISTILEWKFWIPVSRLTYCAYLIHPAWIFFHASILRVNIHYDDMTMMYYFIGSLVVSYCLAVVLTVLVEAPLMTIEKLIFTKEKAK